jgi:hypothetical protein
VLRAPRAGTWAASVIAVRTHLGVVKAITAIDISNATWTVNAQNQQIGSATVTLRRTSDNAVVGWLATTNSQSPSITLTTNGTTSPPLGLYDGKMQFSLKPPAASWNVKATFAGDAAYQAVEAQRAYSKP